MYPKKHRFDPSIIKIFFEHEAFIRNVVYLYIHDKEDVEDLVQDLFLFLICHPLPGNIRDIKSYLYRVTINHVIKAVKRKEKYRDCLYKYIEYSYRPASQKTSETFVVEMENLNAIFELIENRLPRMEAQAVRLRYRYGLSTKVIAKKLGVGNATARSYISNGLYRIRGLLNPRLNPLEK